MKSRIVSFVFVFVLLISVIYIAPSYPESKSDHFNDLISLQIEDLMNIRISNISSIKPKPIQKAPGIVSVITSDMISTMPARNLTDILKIVPGFDVRYSNFGEYIVSSMGVDNPANILVMIDGHRLNDFFSGSPLFDIPVDNIEKIEILRGPGSAIYGTNAMVAVINIFTKRRETKQLKVGAGNFNTKKVNLEYGARTDDFSIFTFAEVFQTDGGNAAMSTDNLWNTQYSRAPMEQKDDKQKVLAHASLEYKKIRLNLNYYREDRGPNFAYQNILSDESSVSSDYFSAHILRVYGKASSIKITPRLHADRWKWNKDIQLYPDGYTDNRDLDNDGDVESFADGIWQKKEYTMSTYGGDIKFERDLNIGHYLTIGLGAEESSLDNTKITTNYSGEPSSGAIVQSSFANWNDYSFPEKKRAVFSTFVEDDWSITNEMDIVIGARYDNYSDFGSTTNSRASLVYNPYSKIAVKLQYATAFRAPTFKELYDQTDPQFYGNPNLKPEKLETYELGIGYSYEETSFVRLSWVKTKIRDYITTLYNTSLAAVTEYENSGRLDIDGYSIEARHTLDDSSWIYSNATLFNAWDKSSSTWLTNIPQFRANVGIHYALPYKSIVGLYWMYSDTVKSNARTWQETVSDTRAQTGPYHLINLALTKKNLVKGVHLKVSVFNLLNTYYREMFSDIRYRFPDTASPYEVKNLPQSNQRMFMLELGKEF